MLEYDKQHPSVQGIETMRTVYDYTLDNRPWGPDNPNVEYYYDGPVLFWLPLPPTGWGDGLPVGDHWIAILLPPGEVVDREGTPINPQGYPLLVVGMSDAQRAVYSANEYRYETLETIMKASPFLAYLHDYTDEVLRLERFASFDDLPLAWVEDDIPSSPDRIF